jgi:SAM-dependent methyltransferase
MQDSTALSVEAHYGRQDLAETILAAVRAAGLDPDRLTPDDLAVVDEFHTRGRQATEELAELAELRPEQRVLDVGCGLGGSARYLAARYDVEVVGVDLTAEYCRAGNMLSELTGLRDRVELVTADALELPFSAGSFDHVWTEHVTMNIADKARLYTSLRGVLRDGGRVTSYEIAAGPGGDVHFPVPWARQPQISFLATPDELRRCLERAGLKVVAWRDVTARALEWFRERAVAASAGTSALGLHLLLGADAKQMFANQVRNLEEDRIRVIQAVGEAA